MSSTSVGQISLDLILNSKEFDTKLNQKDYDLIITGDLGAFGSRVFKDLLWEKGLDIQKNHTTRNRANEHFDMHLCFHMSRIY